MRRRHARAVLFLLLIMPAATWSADVASPRSFAPVQLGFVPSAPDELPYLPARLLVRISAAGLTRSHLALPLEKGAATANAKTGLDALDARLTEVGAWRLQRPFIAPRNQTAAERLGVDRWFQIDLAPGTDVAAAATLLKEDPDLEEVLPDYRVYPAVTPNDPRYDDNWGHENTGQLPAYGWGTTWEHTGPGVGTVGFDANADIAWDEPTGYGDISVVIAILDSGVDTGHPDLDLVAGYDYGSGDSDPDDDSADPGHGTACAGVAAGVANNNLGVAGAAGGCRIMPLKVADNAGALSLSAVTNAIYHAADNGADVISMSFGADTASYPPTDAAISYATNAGLVLLAATGNENADAISYPANRTDVIAVGAASPCGDRKRSSSNSGEVNPGTFTDPNGTTCDGERWWGSNYGVDLQDNGHAVDVIAPTILPTTDISGSGGYRSGDYEPFFNGTSCSTPYAAGVCALIKAANPTWTSGQIRMRLRDSARDIVNVESGAGWDRYAGYGMVDAAAAVSGTGSPVTPAANFSADVTVGCPPLTVTFTDQTSGDVTSWNWDFGDGNGSADQNPVHTYLTAGSFDVSLTATGPGGENTKVVNNYVTASGIPVAAFTPSTTAGAAPLGVNFVNNTSGADTWLWDFGDGATATIAGPFHVYTEPGTYTVSLTAGNPCGVDTLIMTDLIVVGEAQSLTAAFSMTPTSGCAPLAVSYTDISSGDVSSRVWYFGDGTQSPLASGSHTYQAPGLYDVRLIVFGGGERDTLTVPEMIRVDGPVSADFAAAVTEGSSPLEVSFTELTTGGATSWSWDFGDASQDTVANPTHTYTTEGDFTVTLTAGNACGDDSVVKTDLIHVRTPSGTGTPSRFALEQNYPNPFNPATTLSFSLARTGHVRLDIFDADGRRLETLVDASRGAGNHQISWRPRGLASGVYFARLEVDGLKAVRRLVLLR